MLVFDILVVFLVLLSSNGLAGSLRGRPASLISHYRREVLQDIVTWDQYSIFVRGQRILFYSGEFHPFRLPVPGLWLDIFQKIRALGYTGVSFYANWALLEGKEGDFNAEGIFALEPFFDAASEAGIYLLARPGPYINAEVSGGGFPGWLQRTEEVLRTPEFLKYTDNYVQKISAIIAKAQITNGGPIILVQPENEYSQATSDTFFPNYQYFQAVEEKFRKSGIVVPFISNDARPQGLFAPGNGTVGNVDIYGHDAYPQGFDCANPYVWVDGALPTNFHQLHLQQSPKTPYSIIEFQGGSFDPWGGPGFAKCEILTNEQFERVFYKNDFSFGVTLFNIYMTYGGTNWGNLGYALGYTSYDYGSVIAEDRTIAREKYSEAKLEANLLRALPTYLTANPGDPTNGSFVNTNQIAVTQLKSNTTAFYVVRHAAYNSNESTNYVLSIPTSRGPVDLPQLTSTLTLNGRDSKIHVADIDLANITLLYSTAEIFTWKEYDPKKVLIVYGGPNETHELAFVTSEKVSLLESSYLQSEKPRVAQDMDVPEPGRLVTKSINGTLILNWAVSPKRSVLRIGEDLIVYLLDRSEAYNLWVLDLTAQSAFGNFTNPTGSAVIVKAGYLLRTATIDQNTLLLVGDLNTTTSVEIIGAPSYISSLSFNGQIIPTRKNAYGVLMSTLSFHTPNFSLPQLINVEWRYIDSLPEIRLRYDDDRWVSANQSYTLNPRRLTTPTSLYGSDYGFNTGTLLFRGHFVATGLESDLFLQTQGGTAFGHSIWLNSKFLGSWTGISVDDNYNQTLPIPKLAVGQPCVLTIVIDTTGLEEENVVGSGTMKHPRGILRYVLSGLKSQSDIRWKITGNIGGEAYRDRSRGPLNEGGTFAERQGYHLPTPPIASWKTQSPITQGMDQAGIGFFSTTFNLDLPSAYDIPLAFVFGNSSSSRSSTKTRERESSAADISVVPYRVQLFVNGFQFGKYVNNIGPQSTFPVPQGILNYHGTNYVALTLWALDIAGARIESLELVSTAVVQKGYGTVEMAPASRWEGREGAY